VCTPAASRLPMADSDRATGQVEAATGGAWIWMRAGGRPAHLSTASCQCVAPAAAVTPFEDYVFRFKEWDNRWDINIPMPVFGEMGVREGVHAQVPSSQQPRSCSVKVAPVVGCRPNDQGGTRYFPRGRVDAGYVGHCPCVRDAPRVTLDECCADRIVRLGRDAALEPEVARPVPWLRNACACGGGLHFHVYFRRLHSAWMPPGRRCRRRIRDVGRRYDS